MKKHPVIEMFGPTIQGEGALCGQVTNFLRLGGCTYSCLWCDSMHAVLADQVKANATYMTADEIVNGLGAMPQAPWLTLSGGDPCIHNLDRLIELLRQDNRFEGLKLAVETQGALFPEWLYDVDMLTLSPKPPSSGMEPDLARLHDIIVKVGLAQAAFQTPKDMQLVLKVVVFTLDDLNFAELLHINYPDVPFYLSAGSALAADATLNPKITEQPGARYRYTTEPSHIDRGEYVDYILGSLRTLAELVTQRPNLHDCVVLPQLHALIWGSELGR